MRKEVLRMERVTYKQQETEILRDFAMNVYEGEIMGVIPENIYGLSALLDILLYNKPLYDGYIYYCNKLVDSWRDMKRTENRIALIQERSSLVEGQNAAINIFVLRKGFKQEILRQNLYRKQLLPFLEEIQVDIPMDVPVERLSSFERIIVELLRAIVANYRLIILYEVSTVLSDCERFKVYEILQYYTKKGFSFLYITHWYEEVLPVCQRVAIMKNGKIIKMIREEEMNSDMLNQYAREYSLKMHEHGKNVLQVVDKKVVLETKLWQGDFIKKFDFQVREGECLIIQGTNNKLFFEFVRTLTGIQESCASAHWLKEEYIDIRSDRRVAIIQERPAETMLFWGMNYMDNLCMTLDHRIKGIWGRKKIRKSIEKEYGRMLGEDVFEKRLEDLTQIQKYELVYARILLQKPEVVFCIQPFKGVDMVHRKRIWELQEILLNKGIAVVIVALNRLDEVCLADRIVELK